MLIHLIFLIPGKEADKNDDIMIANYVTGRIWKQNESSKDSLC